jgi:hypothetical protein
MFRGHPVEDKGGQFLLGASPPRAGEDQDQVSRQVRPPRATPAFASRVCSKAKKKLSGGARKLLPPELGEEQGQDAVKNQKLVN